MSTLINGSMALQYRPFNTPTQGAEGNRKQAGGQNDPGWPSAQHNHNANPGWNRPNHSWERPQPNRPNHGWNRPQPTRPDNGCDRPQPTRPHNSWNRPQLTRSDNEWHHPRVQSHDLRPTRP